MISMISHDNFNLVCHIWIIFGIALFPVLLKITQPYGKHTKSSWGPMINNRLGWLIMELPALLVFVFFLDFSRSLNNYMVLIAASLWGLHYIHRSLIFPFRLHTKGEKMPVVIMFSAILFNTVNGFLNGYWLTHFAPGIRANGSAKFHVIVGIVLFLAGFVINQFHDRLLIKLREGGIKGYKIPHGGLFKYVSCPNYLGEIISWLGYFIVTFGLPALTFLIWTLVNLIPRAIDNHKWYHQNFPDYPEDRKAVFPYIL